jgi:hypothetical protein
MRTTRLRRNREPPGGSLPISAFADEHVRCALDDADWAAHAAVQMHQRLAELMSTVQSEHPDMPDIVLRTDETRRLRARLSAVDVIETWYFGLFEDEGNPQTPKRGAAARQEFREWLDYRASPFDYRASPFYVESAA